MGVTVHSQSFWECFACQAQSPPHFQNPPCSSAGPSTLQRARHKNPTSSYIPVGCRVNSILLSAFLHQGGVAAVSGRAEDPLVVVTRWNPAATITQVSWPGIAVFQQGRDCSCPNQAPSRSGEDKLVHLPGGDKVRELCLSGVHM